MVGNDTWKLTPTFRWEKNKNFHVFRRVNEIFSFFWGGGGFDKKLFVKNALYHHARIHYTAGRGCVRSNSADKQLEFGFSYGIYFFFRFPGISTNRKQSYAIELILREHQTTYCRSTTIGLDLPKSTPRNVRDDMEISRRKKR